MVIEMLPSLGAVLIGFAFLGCCLLASTRAVITAERRRQHPSASGMLRVR